jgi:hypothetical protein
VARGARFGKKKKAMLAARFIAMLAARFIAFASI